MFLSESPAGNTFTAGEEDKSVVIFSGLLDLVDDDELLAVIGHELGHQHAEHVVYLFLARIVMSAGTALAGPGTFFTLPLQLALAKWSRCAELTCDRAGLLATRDLRPALGVQMAFAGANRVGVRRRTEPSLPAFIRQARDLAEVEAGDALDGIAAFLLTRNASHPFAAWRVMHLINWVEHGNYLDILAGDFARAD